VADSSRLAGIGWSRRRSPGWASGRTCSPPTWDFDTHITDIVNVIHWEELSDAVLVGHSYAGYVVSGAAEQIAGSLKAIGLLDAFLPGTDSAMIDDTTQGLRDAINAAPKTGTIALPGFLRRRSLLGSDADWVDELCTPHPVKTYTDRTP